MWLSVRRRQRGRRKVTGRPCGSSSSLLPKKPGVDWWVKFLPAPGLSLCLGGGRLSAPTADLLPPFLRPELPPDGLGFVPSCLPTDRRKKKKKKKTALASPPARSNCAAVSSSYSCPLTEGLTSQTRCLLPLMSYLAAAAQSSRGLEGAPEPLPIDKSLA